MVGGVYFGPPAWKVPAWPAAYATAIADVPLEPPPADRAELVELLRRICPDRTSPWTAALLEQLTARPAYPPRLLILNLLALQPESLLPAALTRNAAAEVAAGWRIIRAALGHPSTIIAVDRHDKITWCHWRRYAAGGQVRVRTVAARYPQGHPRILLRSLVDWPPVWAGRWGSRRGEPKAQSLASPYGDQVGESLWRALSSRLLRRPEPPRFAAPDIIMLDPLLCWVLGTFLYTRRTGVRPVQVFTSGSGPRLILAQVGTSVSAFLESLGLGCAGQWCIRNGMLAGERIDPHAARIQWDTDMLALCPAAEPEAGTDCVRCGWCVEVCPVGLNPVSLWAAAEKRAGLAVADPREAAACMDCGLCSYVCPARLPLAATIRTMRDEG